MATPVPPQLMLPPLAAPMDDTPPPRSWRTPKRTRYGPAEFLESPVAEGAVPPSSPLGRGLSALASGERFAAALPGAVLRTTLVDPLRAGVANFGRFRHWLTTPAGGEEVQPPPAPPAAAQSAPPRATPPGTPEQQAFAAEMVRRRAAARSAGKPRPATPSIDDGAPLSTPSGVYTNADLARVHERGLSRGGYGTFSNPESEMESLRSEAEAAELQARIEDPTGQGTARSQQAQLMQEFRTYMKQIDDWEAAGGDPAKAEQERQRLRQQFALSAEMLNPKGGFEREFGGMY